jgi:alanine racemase
MDMITLDLTDHPGAAIGDTVELWGPNISVNDVADRAGSISYELLTGVPTRVRRTYT